jgi:Ion channel
MGVMEWLWVIAGLLLVCVGLDDVFHTLLHPTGRGRVTQWVVRAVWWFFHVLPARCRSTAGPVSCLAVIGVWTILQIFGWALVYYPWLPEGFLYSSGIDVTEHDGFAEALYVSLTTLSTVGFGDVVPLMWPLRIVGPLEALTGFALLTASISWFLQLYPALATRRALALRLSMLRRSGFHEALTNDAAAGSATLQDLIGDLTRVRVQLVQNSESYYFQEKDASASLPAAIPYAVLLSDVALWSNSPALRASGAALGEVIDDF